LTSIRIYPPPDGSELVVSPRVFAAVTFVERSK
jgi:hypothetical protein